MLHYLWPTRTTTLYLEVLYEYLVRTITSAYWYDGSQQQLLPVDTVMVVGRTYWYIPGTHVLREKHCKHQNRYLKAIRKQK